MAVYKVIQDIEAEDKLLGPLTLKGFIYAMIAGVLVFISVRVAIAPSLGNFRWGIIVLLLPPILLFGILAGPFGKEQPTEVWLLSHVRFFLKNRKRIWDQSGADLTVVITAPKIIEKQLTKGWSQVEVRSRLKALAATLDSRGWAIKNTNLNLSAPPGYFQDTGDESQRLVSQPESGQTTPVLDIHAKDDILDADNNSTAQYFNELVQKADDMRRQNVLDKFNVAREEGAAIQAGTGDLQVQKKTPESVKLKTGAKNQSRSKIKPREPTVTATGQADKLELAKSGNAFSVASLQRLANRHAPAIEQISPNEVVINLH